MNNIVVIGSLNMDLVVECSSMPKLGQTIIGNDFKQISGGKGANQAVAMARLGANVSMIGKVGEDSFGDILVKNLKEDNIDISSIGIEKGISTGVAIITVDENANNSIVVVPGANYKLLNEDIDNYTDVLSKCDIAVCQLETPLETIKYALNKCKQLNKYTILNPAPAVKLSDDIIKNVDLLTPNETELEILSGIKIQTEEDILKGANILINKGVKELIVTLGDKGALYINDNTYKFYESYNVKAVDTTAAGDSFTGAIAVYKSQGKDINECIDFACKVGALSVTKKGAQSSIPYLQEVLEFKGELCDEKR